MVYGGTAASALGSLLRKAQEERQTGPHLVPQSAQEESPIRQQITGPIVAPESMGSEKVVALKGEMQPIQEGGTAAPMGIDGTANPVVAPVTPTAGEVMAPVAPRDGGPTALNTIPSSFTPSALGTSLLPSSMKSSGGTGKTTSAQLAPSLLPTSAKMMNVSPVQGSRLIGRIQASEPGKIEVPSVSKLMENLIQTKQSPITPVQKAGGVGGAAIDYIGRALGNIFPERNISEKLQQWGGSRSVAATKPTVGSVIKGLFKR